MNIDDVESTEIEIPEGPVLKHIYVKQASLMDKYEEIERANGAVVPSPAWGINDPRVQMRVKDMFWRVTEELAEALEDVPQDLWQWRQKWDERSKIRHVWEEIADALHFLVEASIIVDFEPKDWAFPGFQKTMGQRPIEQYAFRIIMELGLAANCLKNKPWKNTHMETDKENFTKHLNRAWRQLGAMFATYEFTLNDIYILYMKKATVNVFRQRTNY